MSQLDQDTIDDATLADRLRPEEDPWASLAVADDDVLGDGGIPSPVVGSHASEDDDDGRVDDADSPIPQQEATDDPAPAGELAPYDDDNVAEPVPAAVAVVQPDADDDLEETVVTMVDPAIEPTRGGAFTIPMVCAGVAIIACCLLIPQADANRRMAYQQVKLKADLETVERQVAVNDEFLRKVADDPNLAERLAQRQMKIIRPGMKVLALKDSGEAEMSPFHITAVAPPPKLPPYQPRGGTLAQLCYNPKSRLYLIGLGLLLTAAGLVLGFGARSAD
jgi:hypothetical protein